MFLWLLYRIVTTSFSGFEKYLRTCECLSVVKCVEEYVPQSDEEVLAFWPTGAVCCLGRTVEKTFVTSHSCTSSCAGPCCRPQAPGRQRPSVLDHSFAAHLVRLRACSKGPHRYGRSVACAHTAGFCAPCPFFCAPCPCEWRALFAILLPYEWSSCAKL